VRAFPIHGSKEYVALLKNKMIICWKKQQEYRKNSFLSKIAFIPFINLEEL
jgi:hypothetical protein